MGIPVMILGESGSGKSASLRNFKPDEIGVFNVVGKPLPFRNQIPTMNNVGYDSIRNALARATKKAYVIDDSQYLLVNEFFLHANEVGYQKFTDIAVNFRNLIGFVAANTPPDCIVYFLHHTDEDAHGRLKAKTVGKMLDEKLTVEGLFSIVLLCEAGKERHIFRTQSEGTSTAKSPMEMFAPEIDNDLKFVDTTIREYYGMAPLSAPEQPKGDGNNGNPN